MSQFTETVCQGVTFTVQPETMIFEGMTEFQRVHIFSHPVLGRALALDGVMQTTEFDEFIYHEMLTHVPMLGHGNAQRVLIIGGGDGGTLREVLRHPVQRVLMVELDGEIVKLCKAHLPALSKGAFDDPRSQLLIGDGAAFMSGNRELFDVIIIDSTDPVGPGKVLFEPAFMAACRQSLAPGGVLVNQNGAPAFMPGELRESARVLRSVFTHTGFFYAPVPTSVSGAPALGWASDGLAPGEVPAAALLERLHRIEGTMRWYTPAVHRAAFAEPPALRALTRG